MSLLFRGRRSGRTRGVAAARLLLLLTRILTRLTVFSLLSGLRFRLGFFFLNGLFSRQNTGLAAHHFADAAGFFFGLPASIVTTLGISFHTGSRSLRNFSVELGLFGFTAGSLKRSLVGRLLSGLFTSLGFLGKTHGFGRTFGGSAAFSFFAFAARCFFSCAAFFLGLAASFFFGLTLGFCFAASGFFTSRLLDLRLFFGLNLGILHKDAFFTNFNLNGVGTPRSVGLFDDALFFSVDGDLALTCLRTLNAQAVEQPALVGVGKDVVFGVLGDAGSAQLREKRLDGKLQLERKFFNRHAGHV